VERRIPLRFPLHSEVGFIELRRVFEFVGTLRPAIHSANFGVKLQEKLRAIGAECELTYPGASDVKHRHVQDFLIEK
jgi:hypothetical protein